MSKEHCPHCGCESYDDETTCADHIAELEAANAQQALTIHGYMKLVDSLRELPEKWRHEWNQVEHPYAAVRGKLECADDLEALLDSINPPKTDSKVSTVIGKESEDGN